MDRAATSTPKPDAPRLLLDTNVFRALAHGDLVQEGPRLMELARWQTPRILWTALLVHDEIFAHITQGEEERFVLYQRALFFIDQLCGNEGIAEGYPSALRHAMFESPRPLTIEARIATNMARRQILKAKKHGDLPLETREILQQVSQRTTEEKAAWANDRTRSAELLTGKRVLPSSQRRPEHANRDPVDLVVEILTEIFLRDADIAIREGSTMRTPADFRWHAREFLHYEASLILKIGNRAGFDFFKHQNSYYDHLLCTFPSAGFIFVTNDNGIHASLRLGRCPAPRVMSVGDALGLAERWTQSQAGSANS